MKKLISKENIIKIICIIGALILLAVYVNTYVRRSPKLALLELFMNVAVWVLAIVYTGDRTIYGAFRQLILLAACVPMIPLTWISSFISHSAVKISLLEYVLAMKNVVLIVIPLLLIAIVASTKYDTKLGLGNKILICAAALICLISAFATQFVYVAEYLVSTLCIVAFSDMYESVRIRVVSENLETSQRIFYEVVEYIVFFLLFMRALHMYYAMIVY